jgi:hypothetical protein
VLCLLQDLRAPLELQVPDLYDSGCDSDGRSQTYLIEHGSLPGRLCPAAAV